MSLAASAASARRSASFSAVERLALSLAGGADAFVGLLADRADRLHRLRLEVCAKLVARDLEAALGLGRRRLRCGGAPLGDAGAFLGLVGDVQRKCLALPGPLRLRAELLREALCGSVHPLRGLTDGPEVNWAQVLRAVGIRGDWSWRRLTHRRAQVTTGTSRRICPPRPRR